MTDLFEKIRRDFPLLKQKYQGKKLVYLDNAASSIQPQPVISAISDYYKKNHSNIHRASHFLAERATRIFETARKSMAEFLGAKSEEEIIFTGNATAGINLVARAFAGENLKAGDGILLTKMEHSSNLVPWQIIAKEKKLKIEYLEITENYKLDLSKLAEIFRKKSIKMLAVTHVSNVLGTINDIKNIIAEAKKMGVLTLIDAAQSAAHLKLDVQDLGCDFLVLTGHKICGPTGIGVLYGRKAMLEKMKPCFGGGGMVTKVETGNFFPSPIPHRFEAGTPAIAEAAAATAAVDYLESIGFDKIEKQEKHLMEILIKEFSKLDFVKIYGSKNPTERLGIFSFSVEGVHSHDLAEILNADGIAIRAGQHCSYLLFQRLKINDLARASLSFYNNEADILSLINGIKKAYKLFH